MGMAHFHEIDAGLPNVEGAAAWGDYDNDGRLDILLAGWSSYYGYISVIYHNDGNGAFHDIGAGLTGVWGSSAAWGDFNNDGRLDILLTGHDPVSHNDISRVYRNDGNGVFHDILAGLTGIHYGSAAWGDYDNDGRLDILLTGVDGTNWDTPTFVTNISQRR